MNFEMLGNSLPHLHTHVVPRYLDDGEPGQPPHFMRIVNQTKRRSPTISTQRTSLPFARSSTTRPHRDPPQPETHRILAAVRKVAVVLACVLALALTSSSAIWPMPRPRRRERDRIGHARCSLRNARVPTTTIFLPNITKMLGGPSAGDASSSCRTSA
jgi:hypothetical protein